jgi:hypothetical protein
MDRQPMSKTLSPGSLALLPVHTGDHEAPHVAASFGFAILHTRTKPALLSKLTAFFELFRVSVRVWHR